MNRLALLGCAVALQIFVGRPASGQVGPGDQPLRVDVRPGNITSIYSMLGISRGFYKAEGLMVEPVQIATGPQASAALAGRSVDLVLNSPDLMLVFKERGFNPVAVVGITEKPNFMLIARDVTKYPHRDAGYSGVVQDLAGSKVGTYGPSTSAARFVTVLLAESGMKPNYVTYMTAGGPGQSIAGLKTGQMDVVSDVFTTAIVAELSNVGKVLLDCGVTVCSRSLSVPGFFGQSYYTTGELLQSREAAIQAFVRANRKVDAWLHDPANKDALQTELAKVLPAPAGVDPTAYFAAVTARSQQFFGVGVNPAAYPAVQDALIALHELKQPMDVSTMVWSGAPKP